ncbi:helix-turn-helix domain-containing protein [Alicyclobacillus fastidiosus]|uniref:Helix-turn-helix transcriptional regulator n=1 Tax=Alicyclobacillus fastidiosus TaxID=392011 RepID=A0ABV5AM11_9BACL|nr:helix-turn-helix transcriptional regulator [Alicyclobacillus fastidiosus]WEH08513.1 helix-turn-helix transcriptional regulator [Alicyclobacillus fastidiosus]
MELGTLLRICRERKRLSQQNLAFAVGIDRSEVSRLERNLKPIDVITLEMWAKATDGGHIIGWFVAEMLGASEKRWERALRVEMLTEQLRQTLGEKGAD